MGDYKILHKKSISNIPHPSKLEYGELAVRYGENNEAILLKNNNDKIVSIEVSPKISDKYNIITYPQNTNIIFDAIISGQTIESAINTLENNLSKFSDSTLKNEKNVSESLEGISLSIGLENDLIYKPNNLAKYISGTTSLIDADNKLDGAIADISDRVRYIEENNFGPSFDPSVNNYITEEELNSILISYASQEDVNVIDSCYISGVSVNGDECVISNKNVQITNIATLSEINIIGESIGLKSDFTYNPNTSANYINSATSVVDATNILDDKIKNLFKVDGTTLILNL